MNPGCCRLQVQMDLLDVESATILAFKYMMDGSELLKGDQSRHAFAQFLHLLSTDHPIERCACPPPPLRLSNAQAHKHAHTYVCLGVVSVVLFSAPSLARGCKTGCAGRPSLPCVPVAQLGEPPNCSHCLI